MLQGLESLGQAYLSFLNPLSLAYGLGGALLGIIVGCMPGLSATLCIALLTTLTIKLPANDAILILICSYVGTLYGGSRSAILLNIPGTAANAASCADGYALALRGEAGRAIGIATSGAFCGTLFGVLCLAAFTPVLAEVALSFGAFEFFWLALFGVTMSGSLVGNDPLKGWLMGALGLFVAQIGQEGLYAHDRFTFGLHELSGGIALIPALVGAFGFAEVLTTLADPVERKLVELRDSILPRFREVAQYWRTVLRSGAIGVLTGLLPGVGEDSGAWMSYAAAKATSKERHLFGKGSIDGLMAAETGDMSSIPGHIIPALALGIPGSAPSAVLLAAMILHGIQPGPMLMVEHPQFVYHVVAMTTLATICILVFGLFLVRPLLYVLRIKRNVLMPIIFLLATVGAFATQSRLFDVYSMLAVGIGAFFLRRKGYPMAPFVLGLVLGSLLDKSLRRGLVLSDGSVLPFFTRPICMVLAAVTIFTMLLYVPAFNRAVKRATGAARSIRCVPSSVEVLELEKLRLGIIMNGVTGRMGTNQHLVRSICAIRAQGGVTLADGRLVMPDPILVGRNADKLQQLAKANGVTRWSTDLGAALANQEDTVYFDSASTGLRPKLIKQAIAAGKHIYTEKPVAPTLAEALDLYRAAKVAGVKHGVVQDKLWLPGLLKMKMLIDSGFFGRILSVRGEFGYWVFEGDWQPAQRPSWNYRKQDDGGIIVDMLCHWRYVLDNLFGNVKSVSCVGATHIPKRWDEQGRAYDATADDAAYATFELAGAHGPVIAQINSSWTTRVRRDDLATFHVDGTLGSAVAGLTDCWTQARVNTPKPVWNPDVPQTIDFLSTWQKVPANQVYDNAFKVEWELFIRHLFDGGAFRWGLLEGAKGVQLAELGLQSWAERRWIDVDALEG